MAKDLTGDGHGDLYVVGSNRPFIAKEMDLGDRGQGRWSGKTGPDPDRPRADFDTGVSVGRQP